MFTKDEIKSRWAAEKEEARLQGKPEPVAGLNLALLILSSALFHQKDWGGQDYAYHPIHVGFHNTRSTIKQIIGVLHDVLEDGKGPYKWELSDLEELGFHPRIIRGVDGMTSREGENYMEFIVRCGQSGEDAIDKKIEDLDHNSNTARTAGIAHNERMDLKRDAYNISLYYLVAIKKGDIEPGTPMIDFLRASPVFSRTPAEVNKVLDHFSDLPARLEIPAFQPSAAPSLHP